MMKKVFVVLLFIITAAVNAQTKAEKEALKAKKASDEYTYQGNKALEGDKPVQAEVDYRNAIVKNKENVTAQYNLGSLYYQQKSYGEAFARLKKASETPNITDNERHQIFHNLGNTFMKTKEYDKAVQAYKEALRYDSTDEQTRYNLAVAKDMLKKNPPKNDNKDNKDNKNNQDNKDNKNDKNKDNQDNKDNKDNKNDKDKKDNQDNKDNKNDKDKNKDNQDNKDDKNDKGDKDNDNQKPRPSSLSPQQMERILEAMNSEERKTQEKVNGQKVKGQRSKSEKDW